MKNTPISCFACSEATIWSDEKSYREHLLKAHQATSSDQAMINEKNKEMNIPKNLPPGIPQDALPTPEFLEAIKRIEEKPKQIPIVPNIVQLPTPEIKPIVLEYQYIGTCPVCKFPIKTIMLNVGKRLFAIAFCTNCNKELKTLEVKSIKQ